MMLKQAGFLAVVLLGLLSDARAADVERVTFTSATDFGSTKPLELEAYLTRPDGPGPFPAVVMLHGCGGIRPNTEVWQRFFTERGYATFAVDSFLPRGVTEICRTTGQVTWSMRAADAFGALDHLARQPFVRPDAVLVMGFSHGAGIALDVASSFRLNGRPAGAPRFRAALSLYPGCGHKTRQNAEYRIPVFIGVGAEDDWTPPRPCQELVAKQPGKVPMDLRLYAGAAHSFDNLDRPVTFLPAVLNKNSPTGKGATVGGSPEALAAAQADVDRFLSKTIR